MMARNWPAAIFGLSMALALCACNREPAPPRAPAEDKLFDVVVTGIKGSKIKAIKGVREVTGWGLKQAYDFVEAIPKVFKTDLPEAKAEALADRLRQSYLIVELRRK
ncbi:MAG: ribosomal protein L7/L12 [Planctomycetota bacterium]|jgi:large subunit ribosomal protein L7/L12